MTDQNHLVLTINPGSTSTKIALFRDKTEAFSVNLSHSTDELAKYDKITEQYEFRKELVIQALKENQIELTDLAAIVGRGGLLKPIPGGTYEVNDAMLEDLRQGILGEHASNLGGIIAHSVAKEAGCPSYIVDPVVVDEMAAVARLSGNPLIPRISIFHALNQKAVARRAAEKLGKKYEKLNLIVVHMGGGISAGIHHYGKVVDVNNALNGDGPFTPERSGGLPAGQLVDICFSGKFNKKEIKSQLKGKGGMTAYLGTNDARILEDRVRAGDEEAILIHDAMAYQVAKEIGLLATVVKGKVDAIILTGGLAYDPLLTEKIKDRVSFIADVINLPGEKEMEALCEGALRVLNNEEDVKIYK